MDIRFIPDDLSVVILTYNRPQRLLNLLKKIPKSLEIVVADDGTLPSIKDILPEHVKLYTHEHFGNRASTCRNEGVKLTTRPKVLMLDDDVTPNGYCYMAHSLALEMYDISVGLLTREPNKPYTDDRLLFYMRDDLTLWNWFWSGNFAIRRDVFFEVGGFDEKTFNGTPEEAAHGFEDIDLGRRLWLANKRMVLNKLALAHHPGQHTAENPSPAVLRNQRRYYEKWGES